MEILSLRSRWSSGPPSASDYIRSLNSLLEALAAQEEGSSSSETARFREEVRALAGSLTSETTAKDLAPVIDAAIQSFRKFSSSSAARISAHLSELKATIRALTETVTFLAESRSSVVHNLMFIGRQLEQANELEDIRLLRPKLTACLELVREETARLENESAANSELVRSSLGVTPQHTETPRRVGSLDPVTGLPARHVAQRLIEDKIAAGKKCVVALFIPDRLESINRRHGRNAGDEVLLLIAQHLAKGIQPPATLCRWSGPAFLALVESEKNAIEISRAWKSNESKPLAFNVQIERRSVMVSVSLSCTIKIIDGSSDAEKLYAEMDKALGPV